MENFAELSWIAIIVGTVASFMVGWAWYSPMLFGKPWAAGSGVDLGDASEMPVMAMVSQMAALFFLAMVIGITATAEALITAILAILAAATFVMSQGGFVKKSGAAIAIDFFYIVVSGVIMIVCQAIF
mgnify:FL=1